jgi:hypothetical protein
MYKSMTICLILANTDGLGLGPQAEVEPCRKINIWR